MRQGLLILALAAAASPVPAQDYTRLPGVEYYCTDAEGKRRELGEVICITASCQSWMARCDMSLNSPTWRKMQDGCPGVEAPADRLRKLGRG
jgi:hypothetical protein